MSQTTAPHAPQAGLPWFPKSWTRATARISVCIFAAVAGFATWMALSWLGFSHALGATFGLLIGLQTIILFGLGAVAYRMTEQQLSRWSHRLQLKGWPALVGLSSGVLLFTGVLFGAKNTISPHHSWTLSLLAGMLCTLGGLGCALFATCWSKQRRKLAPDTGNRFFALAAALFVMMGWAGSSLGMNLLAGTHWWHHDHVEVKAQKDVVQRGKELQSLRMTRLYDRDHKYLGVYAKTRSDWNPAYNAPDILQWRLSRVIKLSEGAIQTPSWWWRMMPKGRQLKCLPFSFTSFLKAPYYWLKQGRKVGGSPPSLQAAKNLLDYGRSRQALSLQETIRIKLFKEMPRAYIMCQSFTPAEMMGIYLTTVWSGKGDHYGIHRMALYFFGESDPRRLTWNQATVLVASLPNPGRMNPWYLRSCWKDRCINKSQARVYRVWRKRIHQLKQKLRARGYRVSAGLPAFKNGLHKRVKVLSNKWKYHDAHIRKWLPDWLPTRYFNKTSGDNITLTYDRQLTTGTAKRKGTIHVARAALASLKGRLDKLQLSFSLIDATTGAVRSQYGGRMYLDMASVQKPVMGSVFKTITLLAAHQWPDGLPLLNHGKHGSSRRIFVYHPTDKERYHSISNGHSMPPYLHKTQALAASANVAFVYLSLHWTWMLSPQQWKRVMYIGLQQMLRYRMGMTQRQARRKARQLLRDPEALIKLLKARFGYGPYFKKSLYRSVFEAAKGATVKALLREAQRNERQPSPTIALQPAQGSVKAAPQGSTTTDAAPSGPALTAPQRSLRTKDLTDLIAARYDSQVPENDRLKEEFSLQKRRRWRRHKEDLLQQVSWNREFRMEMGLRYLIFLATQLGGFDIRKSHLQPVLTLTLGVNNASTRELATLAASFAAERPVAPYLIEAIERRHNTTYRHRKSYRRLPLIPPSAFQAVKKAMGMTLRRGTAARSGRLVNKALGTKALLRSGAKTGTVQDDRGISCIGFVGRYAGAITLSTPNQRPLKTHVLRNYIRKAKERAARRVKQLKQKRQRITRKIPPKKRPPKARRINKQLKRAKARLSKATARIKQLKQTARTYDALRRKVHTLKRKQAPKKTLRQVRRKLRKYKYRFKKAFKPKKLRSSDACVALFKLLIHWKKSTTAAKRDI